jgi:quercetin dioxygenase-like cupin family protein
VYYVEKGHGVIIVDDEPTIVSAGHYAHVAPGEPHSILNHTGLKDDHPDEDLVIIFFGVSANP